jgi:hypothetical protein
MNLGRRQPVLITSAAESRQTDIQRRQRRYLISMAFRVVCFVLAVLAFTGWVRFVAVAVAMVLPWVAVVAANGGPLPSRDKPTLYSAAGTAPGAPAALESAHHPVVDLDDLDLGGPDDGPDADGRDP